MTYARRDMCNGDVEEPFTKWHQTIPGCCVHSLVSCMCPKAMHKEAFEPENYHRNLRRSRKIRERFCHPNHRNSKNPAFFMAVRGRKLTLNV